MDETRRDMNRNRVHIIWAVAIIILLAGFHWSDSIESFFNGKYAKKFDILQEEYEDYKEMSEDSIAVYKERNDSLQHIIQMNDRDQNKLINNNKDDKDENEQLRKDIPTWSDNERDEFWRIESTRYDPSYRFDTLQNIP